jgi:hypothetical protein
LLILRFPVRAEGRDAELKAKIAAPIREAGRQSQDKYGHLAAPRALASGRHLLDVLERVPVFVAACMHGRPHGGNAELSAFYGSVYPALWSLQLALRSRGLGSTIVGYHLADREQDVAQILGMHTPHVVGGSGGVVLLLNPRSASPDSILSKTTCSSTSLRCNTSRTTSGSSSLSPSSWRAANRARCTAGKRPPNSSRTTTPACGFRHYLRARDTEHGRPASDQQIWTPRPWFS